MTSNRLDQAASAYLQSAAHQPIHWHPWGPEAFAAAQAQNRPVLLDIGAVWCHWCHVMDGESYEDPAIAAYLNENFICIKVDRDERPDVDARYQRAVQAFTRQGGWPLTAFLTPDGQVFFGGTYFPPEGKYGQPGFRTVLASVLDAYHSRRGQIEAQAQAIRKVLDTHLDESVSGEPSAALLSEAERAIAGVFDPVNGGFGSQPKFPHPTALTFLLHRWHDQPGEELRTIIDRTLEGMARGGMYDQLGGGFHRYSVDAKWIVPHFEKMSYDNSELLVTYALSTSLLKTTNDKSTESKTGSHNSTRAIVGPNFYRAVAQGILRWVREVLADPDGGYGASQDADVGLDDDGDYFTWTRDEAATVLSERELEVASAYYDLGTAGEMHHNPSKNVLFIASDIPAISRLLRINEDDVEFLLCSAEDKLRAERSLRSAPFVDHTRYTSWNAMMASALLVAGPMLGDSWARQHALRTLNRIRSENAESDAVAHSPGGATGLLEDQVHTAAAALSAYEVTGEQAWLDWGEALMERVYTDYRDAERGGLFDVAEGQGQEGLLGLRVKPIQDSPAPSANGVATLAMIRLYHMTGDDSWQTRAEEQLRVFGGSAVELGLHGATYLLALDWFVNPVTHLVIVAAADDPVGQAMHDHALATAMPRRILQRLSPDRVNETSLPAALRAMLQVGAAPRAYLCVGNTCQLPASTLAEWESLLAELNQVAE